MKFLKRIVEQEIDSVLESELSMTLLEFQNVVYDMAKMKEELVFELGAISDLRQELQVLLNLEK